ncbi:MULTISPECIES: DUF6941 family protein [unclassified Bradyrhizobium]|uniref:DUF6941 family protein n=1 Tax=unclassified Bradyrhizobium TaxID=2631580 RepID=UPI0028E1914F|nr:MULTISPECIES: hypothetical protein [unclassified Bradyrhizobium]
MIEGISAFALFCEDVRKEAAGRTTIIGMMGDTIHVPDFPSVFPRVTCYFRVKFDVNGNYDKPLVMDLEASETNIVQEIKRAAPRDLIDRAIANARNRGLIYGSISGRVRMDEPLEFPKPTVIYAVLRYGDEKMICGVLNVARPSTSQNAPE